MSQQLQTASKFTKFQFLKKSIQFLLKLSIFSLLFSYFSWPAIFAHSINIYSSSTFPHNTIDRNYMFLICIGILVFIAKNSGLVGPSHFETEHDLIIKGEFSERIGDGLKSQIEFTEMNHFVENEEEEGEEEEKVENVSSFITQGEEEEQENELSTEELKKKFDDFIKKMKQNIRFEAQQIVRV